MRLGERAEVRRSRDARMNRVWVGAAPVFGSMWQTITENEVARVYRYYRIRRRRLALTR
jgi:hypothetical protein